MRPARREDDSRGYVPTICEDCDRYGSCEYDPADCEPVACERAAEERWDAARQLSAVNGDTFDEYEVIAYAKSVSRR